MSLGAKPGEGSCPQTGPGTCLPMPEGALQPKQLPGTSSRGVAEHSRSHLRIQNVENFEECGNTFLLPSTVPGIEAPSPSSGLEKRGRWSTPWGARGQTHHGTEDLQSPGAKAGCRHNGGQQGAQGSLTCSSRPAGKQSLPFAAIIFFSFLRRSLFRAPLSSRTQVCSFFLNWRRKGKQNFHWKRPDQAPPPPSRRGKINEQNPQSL